MAAQEQQYTETFIPDTVDNERLANLCGPLERNLRQIEQAFEVRIQRRAERFSISGEAEAVRRVHALLARLYRDATRSISEESLHIQSTEARLRPHESAREAARAKAQAESARGAGFDQPVRPLAPGEGSVQIQTRRGPLQGRTENQDLYLRNILSHDVSFGIGPAGTGKTYLAVACAAQAVDRDEVQRIILTRPAVEAGERLGFLPGDLSQKVDPYLRPLYDALYDLFGVERVGKLFERQMIEIAPLAYMRGRTLNNSFIILDEAQNTTPEQMKMFLTRIGFGSRAVITGDITQVDLPRNQSSGLVQAARILGDVKGIAFTHFTSADVVRHPLVARIVEAYERDAR